MCGCYMHVNMQIDLFLTFLMALKQIS
jgi:hypothetical protein